MRTDRFRFFSEEGRRKARKKRIRSIFQGGTDPLEDTMIDFRKVIYEDVEKK